jgi:hypothetical protein
MSWAELTFSKNPPERILSLYHAPNVVTRERLPRTWTAAAELPLLKR